MHDAMSDATVVPTSTLRRIGSRLRRFGSGSKREKPPVSPIITTPTSPKFPQELDATGIDYAPIADNPSDDPRFQQLREGVDTLLEIASTVPGVDFSISAYSECRERCLNLCKVLVKTCQNLDPCTSLEMRSFSRRDNDRISDFSMNDTWLSTIHDFKIYQKALLGNLRASITSTYLAYEPHASAQMLELLLSNESFQSHAIMRMRSDIPFQQTEDPDFWRIYKLRLLSYERLKLDSATIEQLFVEAKSGNLQQPDEVVREYDIASNGDTILEFRTFVSEIRTTLRFRVSSHILAEASPYFARILSSSVASPAPQDTSIPHSPKKDLQIYYLRDGTKVEVSSSTIDDKPEEILPTPSRETLKDGTEVKVYPMPQLELNQGEALTTLLHAAHHHNERIPRQVKFDEFVSIAEVCLRYQCTSPLEMMVEYRWLQQWLHTASEEAQDGLLLISYVFGLQQLFTSTSKSAILNITNDEELQSKVQWPQKVKEKIGAVRKAKLEQIYATCSSTIEEYFPPSIDSDFTGISAGLTSTPRCPKGSHQCDATNLGWLMLFFNQLGILSLVTKATSEQYPPGRSIKELLTSLRRMPTASQIHGGTCDRAPSFRNAMNDIFNSIAGLTLRDVSDKDGWALSKTESVDMEPAAPVGMDVFELAAPVAKTCRSKTLDEVVTLRILSYLDDLRDVQSAAMINKSFFAVYKKHELALMRNLARSGKRRVNVKKMEFTSTSRSLITNESTVSISATIDHVIPLPTKSFDADGKSILTPDNPPHDPVVPVSQNASFSETKYSGSDIRGMLYLSNEHISNFGGFQDLDPDFNTKFLTGDGMNVHKTLVVEGKKHLREEHDRSIGVVVNGS